MVEINKIFETNTKLNKNEEIKDLGSSKLNLMNDDEGIEKSYGFEISPHQLETIMSNYKERGLDFKDLKYFRSQNGIGQLIKSLLTNEISGISSIEGREESYGLNKVFIELVPPFCAYVWEALEDMIVRILIVCAAIQIILGCHYLMILLKIGLME